MPKRGKASRFVSNPDCEYFPCHEMGAEGGPDADRGPETSGFNCLFCYCPLYHHADCPGNPRNVAVNGRLVRDCAGCDFPHRPENYEKVLRHLAAMLFGDDTRAAARGR